MYSIVSKHIKSPPPVKQIIVLYYAQVGFYLSRADFKDDGNANKQRVDDDPYVA